MKSLLLQLILVVLLGATACKQDGKSGAENASASEGDDRSANTESTQDPYADQYFKMVGDFAGSHILIAFQGASRAKPEITRSKEEALEKAKQLLERLQEEPNLFEELAKMESDGPSGPKGGFLGAWRQGAMVPEFDDAVSKLEVGQLAAEPVETSFGYHLIRRDAIPSVKHYSGYAFFVGFAGQPNSPAGVTRTKEEALALCQELQTTLSGDNFEEMAKKHNDMGDGPAFLGVLKRGDNIPPGFFDALDAISYDEVGGPAELPFAFAFLKRSKVERRAGSHILIAYKGSERANPSVTRSKEEALEKAKSLIAELGGNPDQFAEVAKQNSDGPTAPRGGRLNSWFVGEMVPEFETAIAGLQEGQITMEPVETAFGYHIIKRESLDE